MDLIPAQNALDHEIIRKWRDGLPGWIDLNGPFNHAEATTGFALARMVRFLSQTKAHPPKPSATRGVLALNLVDPKTMGNPGR